MSYDLAAVWSAAAVPLALTGLVLVLCLAAVWLAWCRWIEAQLSSLDARVSRLEGEPGRG